MKRISYSLLTAFVVVCIGATGTLGQDWKRTSGYNALVAELGGSVADGSGVSVCMIEARDGQDRYRPNYNDGEFLNPNKNFIDCTNNNTGTSSHANTVAIPFFGNNSSVAPGITDVTLYEAEDWLNFVTGLATASVPDAQPFGVQNHSYVGNGASVGVATNLMQRGDYMASANDMVMIVGDANGGALPQFMVHGFNGITVGRSTGVHGAGKTVFYHPGRVKPDLVADNGATSFGTPTVSSTAAALRDAAAGSNADHAELIRALILAGATKTEFDGWNNSTDRPLDVLFGFGELNFYNSYKMLLGGETDGVAATPTQTAGRLGWDFGTVSPNQVLNYSFELDEPVAEFSIVLSWDITIEDINSSTNIFVPDDSLANLQMFMVGPGGFFQSMSDIYNAEHLYLRDLPAGTYTLAVQGDTSTFQVIDFGLAWRATSTNNTAMKQLDVVSGVTNSGGLSEIGASDDSYLEVQVAPGENEVTVEFESNADVEWMNILGVEMESSVGTPNLLRTTEFFNFRTGIFVPRDFTATRIKAVRNGIGVDDAATGVGYLMYTQRPVHDRFPTANARNAVNLIAVRLVAGQWQYNDNLAWLDFTPEPNDRLLAIVDYSADITISLEGTSTQVAGIESGYLTGNIEFFANQWDGEPNDGEFDVTGTYFTVFGDGADVGDSVSVSELFGENADYLQAGTGCVRARVSWQPSGPIVTYPWTVRIDRAEFAVSN